MNLTVQQTLVIVIALSLTILIARRTIRKQKTKPDQLPGLLLATLSALGGVQIVIKAVTDNPCQDFLQTEGSLALVIGGGFATWLGYKEIVKLYTAT
jgi:hypothetical protein